MSSKGLGTDTSVASAPSSGPGVDLCSTGRLISERPSPAAQSTTSLLMSSQPVTATQILPHPNTHPNHVMNSPQPTVPQHMSNALGVASASHASQVPMGHGPQSSSAGLHNPLHNNNSGSAAATHASQQHPSFALPPHLAALLGAGFPGGAHHSLPGTQGPNGPQMQTQHHHLPYGSAASNPHSPATPGVMQGMSHNPAAVAAAAAAAAAHVVAAHAAASASSGAMANALLVNMQHWKLDQFEAHVQMLRDNNQPIPQPVALMLADARRKEDKRTAKRVANRKSACTSRARKKALVEEMTRTNARLRRQALILALLPDLVIAITIDGEITFCSAQVERVLHHKIDELVGANLSDILIPSSRDALRSLIDELVTAEQAANEAANQERDAHAVANETNETKAADVANLDSAQSSSAAGGVASSGVGAILVSEQSFPLAVVKVESRQNSGEENSDISTSNQGGKPTAKGVSVPLSRSPTSSSFGICGDDEAMPQEAVQSDLGASSLLQTDTLSGSKPRPQTSSDESLSSSSDAKNLRKANEALDRNVRWHNEKLLSKSKSASVKGAHKDDVTGASVTANNASARLSSLQHRPAVLAENQESKRKVSRYESLEDQSSACSSDSQVASVEKKKKRRKNGNENSSDDSGYRESSESLREDTSSSASDASSNSQHGRRPKPLAPTCNICLVRDDLTTIWCEVTSSIRTRSIKDETEDATAFMQVNALGEITPIASKGSVRSLSPTNEPPSPPTEVKELLLCLRPIRDGDERVDESFRLVHRKLPPREFDSSVLTTEGPYTSTTSSNEPDTTNSTDSTGNEAQAKQRPPKKRLYHQDSSVAKISSSSNSNDSDVASKKRRLHEDSAPAEDTDEKSVVESLMLMSHKNK